MAFAKYKFLDEFKEEGGEDSKGKGETKVYSSKNFGQRIVRRIAKCEYKEVDGKIVCKRGKIGGWIEKYSNLSQKGDCWVEGEAVVCVDAVVSGNAVIKGRAEVGDSAKVSGEAVVEGEASIGENALVKGGSHITDKAEIKGGAYLESACVSGESELKGNIRVRCRLAEEQEQMSITEKRKKTIHIENSKISGNVYITGANIYIGEESELSGNVAVGSRTYITKKALISGNSILTNTVVAGPVDINDVISSAGCIGMVKNLSSAWEKRQKRGVLGDKPSILKIAESFSG